MKIYSPSHSSLPSAEASSLQVMCMSEALSRLGHEVVVFGFRSPGRAEDLFVFYDTDRTFQVLTYPKPKVRGIGIALFAGGLSRAWRSMGAPDLFYGREVWSLLAGARLGVPLFYEVHIAPQTAARRAVERRLFSRPNFLGLVTNCEALRAHYVRHFRRLNETNTLTAASASRMPRRTPARKVDRQSRGRFQVGFVGSLSATRGVELVVKLAALNPDLDFHLLGGREGEAEAWRRRVSAPNVEFHGFLPQRELADWHERFDVTVAPYAARVISSDRRTDLTPWMSPLKVVESMAYGQALICSDFPVLREFLSHGANAWLVPPDDLEAWNAALRMLRDNPRLRENLGARARADFLARHTYEHRARRVLDFIARRMGQSER